MAYLYGFGPRDIADMTMEHLLTYVEHSDILEFAAGVSMQ